MKKPSSPIDFWTNAIEAGQIMAEAQMVIGMRVMGMAGMWSVTSGENQRMMDEKTEAMTASAHAAGKVAMSGGSADQIMAAAMKPIRQKTRANAKRLAKRGPKGK